MTLTPKISGPFGIPGGAECRQENPDGVLWTRGNDTTYSNVYDSQKPFPLLVAGDYENVRETTPDQPDPYRG